MMKDTDTYFYDEDVDEEFELEADEGGFLSVICSTLNVSQARALSRYRYVSLCSTALLLAWFSIQLLCCGLLLVYKGHDFFIEGELVGSVRSSRLKWNMKVRSEEHDGKVIGSATSWDIVKFYMGDNFVCVLTPVTWCEPDHASGSHKWLWEELQPSAIQKTTEEEL